MFRLRFDNEGKLDSADFCRVADLSLAFRNSMILRIFDGLI